MKKLLATLAALAVAALLAFGVGSLRWRPSHREGAPRLGAVARGAGPLLAGAAVVPLEPAPPVAVAGFPRLHWPEEGRRDPVAVRAVALREPGCTLVLASIELLLVPGPLARAVAGRVRDLGLDHLVVAATHTHAGPGGFWDDALGERLATGPYSGAVFDHVVERTAQAVRRAVEAAEPAYLSVARGSAPELVRNRGRSADVDGRLLVLRLDALAGHRIADVVFFPAHATLLGLDNRRISGDWPGALMRGGAAPLLFFQGALGDQTPRIPEHTSSAPEAYARRVRTALAALAPSRAEPWPELAVASASAVLPPADLGASPPWLKRVTRNLLYRWLPDQARLAALRVGPVTLLAVPGEPVAEVGRRWRAAAGEGAEILALAGDYLGYVETSERMAEQAGETVRTYYGPELADRLAAAVTLAAEAVRDPAALERTAAADQNRTTGSPRSPTER